MSLAKGVKSRERTDKRYGTEELSTLGYFNLERR